MSKKRIMMIFGGESSEHEISLKSAINVYKNLDKSKYDIKLCYIDEAGRWWLVDSLQLNKTHSGTLISPDLGAKSFVDVETGSRYIFDAILPILHGGNGEDGSVQGLAQLLHIPIVGCDMTSSAICMDKIASKEILSYHGIKIAPYIVFCDKNESRRYSDIKEILGPVLFVKPSRSGSSVGVSKVSAEADFESAITEAAKHSGRILIEKAIDAREIEVSILCRGGDIKASTPGEIIPGDSFYSYEDKYLTSGKSRSIPPDISGEIVDMSRNQACRIFEILGCKGFARVDFFLDRTNNELLFNEINTIPGFTDESTYPDLWEYDGLSQSYVLDQLIDSAINGY